MIHFNGRQPMLADLRSLPGPRDVSVLATNVRTRDGKRPSFVEEIESWFLIPLREVVVIELPSDVLDGLEPDSEPPVAAEPARRPRSTATAHAVAPPVEPVVTDQAEPEVDDMPIEPDEELLARIRQL